MKASHTKTAQYILIFILGWTFFFNITIKELHFIDAFFKLIDTISEDMIMGAGGGIFVALLWGTLMVLGIFFTQTLSLTDGFARFDSILHTSDSVKTLGSRLINISKEPSQAHTYPSTAAGVMLSLSMIYASGLISVFMLAQILFLIFEVSINNIQQIVLFSLAPVMAFRSMSLLKYPFTVVLVPFFSIVFGLILFIDTGIFWLGEDTHFSLFPTDKSIQKSYIYSAILYSFLLVLLEGLSWLVALFSSGEDKE